MAELGLSPTKKIMNVTRYRSLMASEQNSHQSQASTPLVISPSYSRSNSIPSTSQNPREDVWRFGGVMPKPMTSSKVAEVLENDYLVRLVIFLPPPPPSLPQKKCSRELVGYFCVFDHLLLELVGIFFTIARRTMGLDTRCFSTWRQPPCSLFPETKISLNSRVLGQKHSWTDASCLPFVSLFFLSFFFGICL